MLRRCSVLAALLWLGLTARAGATVSVVLGSSDPDAYYLPGETITLTVRVTANGGEASNAVSGNILYPAAFVSRNQQPLYRHYQLPGGFEAASLDVCSSTPTPRCPVFSQRTSSGLPVAPNITNFLISETFFGIGTGVAPGTVVAFNWVTSPPNQLNFFGISPIQPGYSVTIIPEPATAALLCVGLLGVPLAARRTP